jgi:phosphopantothenate synthetase
MSKRLAISLNGTWPRMCQRRIIPSNAASILLELLASGDVDLLYDARHRITLVSEKMDSAGLLGLLKKADKSFEAVQQHGYRAANAGQFMVDLVIAPRDTLLSP